MFKEFSKRKCEEYLSHLEFPNDEIYFKNIKQSNFPPYIINFFDCSLKHKKIALKKEEFEKLLQNAVVFNINYVIKPKGTLLKFLFGSSDARPTEHVIERLCYFQFYRYYTDAIIEFIQLHSHPVISISQVEKLLNEINKKILDEISSDESSDTQRLNLVKLPYHFFIDLTENNPINIKLPKTVLSAFFQDKSFNEIKKRTDNFFKEDIFIQEAVELMKKKKEEEKKAEDVQSKAAEKTLQNSKSGFLNTEITAREIDKTKPVEQEQTEMRTEFIEEVIGTEIKQSILDKNIYSEELLSVSANDELRPEENIYEDWKEKILDKLFCEEHYRIRIVKKLFGRDEDIFKKFMFKLFDINNWETASEFIDNYFTKNKIDYYSEEAVKFVDIMNDHFAVGKNNDESMTNVH